MARDIHALDNALYAHRQVVRGVCDTLTQMSNAAAVMGMDHHARSLWTLAKELDDSVEHLHKVRGQDISDMVADQEAGSAQFMTGMLDLVRELGPKED